MRIGHGYDIHRFEEHPTRDFMMLGGIKIPYERGIVAHSDGDIAIHALCDALLGAVALGDIGQHFPDTDPRYANMDSKLLLKSVVEKIAAMGFAPLNVDLSVIAEAPKLKPYIIAMRESLSVLLGVNMDQVSVKATTNEKMDAIGEKKAIAVHAVVLLTSIQE
ncbi:MAG: 2-C-methyl-D-erythritol 2,4-cyclodiphosphate synthase [Gammaproteobacteria bacterium]